MTDIADNNRQPWQPLKTMRTSVSINETLTAAMVRLIDCMVSWQKRAAERHHLSGLDDRLLKDMGLSRADVDQEISKPFWRV